ncbi:magnesium transporter, partial [Streptococcus pneumoniae]|nr:magnesium transporter [Streptococcus pneumoniae]
LYRLKIDPAVASGPLITTINDILSLLIYFGLASLFISRLM